MPTIDDLLCVYSALESVLELAVHNPTVSLAIVTGTTPAIFEEAALALERNVENTKATKLRGLLRLSEINANYPFE